MELITDRTAQDVERWRELKDKGWAGMTPEEQTQWMGDMKGCYGAADMNRVEGAVELLAARLSRRGYPVSPEVKTNWTRSDIPTAEDLNRYFGNVAKLRKSIAVFPATPPVPGTGNRMDYIMANNLEKILLDVERAIVNMEESWLYAGEAVAGGVL